MTAAAASDGPAVSATAAAAAPAVPAPRRGAGRSAHLRLVPGTRGSAPRTPFVVVVVSLLGLGLLGLLGLNTLLAQDAFRLHTLTVEARQLADREQALRQEVDGLTSPASLADRARALGMVPAGPPAFLRLPDGTVLGAPEAGAAAPAPAVPGADPAAAAADPAAPATAPADPADAAPPAEAPEDAPR